MLVSRLFFAAFAFQTAASIPINDEKLQPAEEKRDLLNGLTTVIGGATHVVDGALTDVGIIADGVTSLVGGAVTDVVDVVDGVVSILPREEKRDLVNGLTTVIGGATHIVDGALTDVGIIVDGVTSLVGGAVTDVVDVVDGLVSILPKRDLIHGLTTVIGGVTHIVDGALTDVGIIVDGVTSLVGGAVTDVVDVVDGLVSILPRDVSESSSAGNTTSVPAVNSSSGAFKLVDFSNSNKGILIAQAAVALVIPVLFI